MRFDSVRHLKVGDLELAYREAGSGDPVVFVHGWPLSSLTWRKVVPGLADRFRCVALDLLGAGESLAPAGRPLGLGAQATLLGGFLDALGLDRAALVGHDSGGSVARSFAIAHPERVSRLVLADTEVPGHRPWFVVALQNLSKLPGAGAVFRTIFRSKALARSPLGFGLSFAELGRFDFSEFHAALVAPNARSEAALRGSFDFLRAFDFAEVDEARPSYERLGMPKLLLWGEGNRIFPPREGRRLLEMLPEPKQLVQVPGAGLFVHEEQPAAWLSAVRGFLEAEAPGRAGA